MGRSAAVLQVTTLAAGGVGALVGGQVAAGFGLTAPAVGAAVILLAAAGTVWAFRVS